MTPEEIIPESEIERIHANANFGHMSKRRVVDEGVLKYALGWTGGSTQLAILKEHGLVRQRNPQSCAATLTNKGKRYLRAMQGNTALHLLLNAMSR